MDCSNANKILSENIEGNGTPEQQVLIEEHLQSCEQCRLYAADIKKTIETLHALDEIEPPAWLTAKAMKKIRTESKPGKTWIERLFFPLHVKLPIEAFAAFLITVAAIFIYKNMGPELQQMEVQPSAPATPSILAVPEKEMQKEERPNNIVQPQRLQEEAKQKDNFAYNREREITAFKEEKPAEQIPAAPAISPVPAPGSSVPYPAPPSAMKHAETGKASGMAARDETMQRAAPAAPVYELQAKKKAADITTITLAVKALDTAKKEIETYVARNSGELKTLDQSASRIILTVALDPTRTDKFLDLLISLGRLKEDRQALSRQAGPFKLIIEKQ